MSQTLPTMLAASAARAGLNPRSAFVPSFPDGGHGWRVIHGRFIAINAASMSCACPRSPKGLAPSAHLADGTADLILVRSCSHLDFFRHLLRHTTKGDQVNFPLRPSLFGQSFFSAFSTNLSSITPHTRARRRAKSVNERAEGRLSPLLR